MSGHSHGFPHGNPKGLFAVCELCVLDLSVIDGKGSNRLYDFEQRPPTTLTLTSKVHRLSISKNSQKKPLAKVVAFEKCTPAEISEQVDSILKS